MKKPVLVIMAEWEADMAGWQIDPVDQEGHIIMDFSIFDAKQGFEKVVFIKKKMKQILKKLLERELRRSWM